MKLNILFYFLVVTGIIVFGSWVLYPTGSPGGKTGSPGDGGATCTQCHLGTPQQVAGWISSNIPAGGYIPGETYTITAMGNHNGVVKFGFEATAEDGSGIKRGTIMVTNPTQTQLVNANKAITHTINGTTPFGSTKTWTFDWTAPAPGTGDITFYAAFNAANGNGTSTGDVIYNSNLTVSEGSLPQNTLTVQFSGMTPHLGQLLGARLINKYDLREAGRVVVPSVPSASFEITFEGVEDGQSFFIDLFADHNGNGVYDPPPADHAWKLSADNVVAGSSVNFSHNTDFSDIDWKYVMTLDVSTMTPHVGQLFEARLVDINRNFKEAGRITIEAIPSAGFSVDLPFMELGHSYYLEFYADLNGNGRFDPVPADHSWRLEAMEITGDQTLEFSHNTNFSDIPWTDLLTIELAGMTPHLGQQLMLRVVNSINNMETGRYYRKVDLTEISVMVPALSSGNDYRVDLFADVNGNGMYDPPPTDHAWRMEATDTQGNVTLPFSHNTNFTDIDWKYLVTLHAIGMTPHIGQLFELRVYDEQTSEDIGMVTIESLMVPNFYIEVPGSSFNVAYNIDFYADHNGSGAYDPPPTDHAWRLQLQPATVDTVLDFTHNTDFTNINWPVSIDENLAHSIGLRAFPNPVKDFVTLSWTNTEFKVQEVYIYSVSGMMTGRSKLQENQPLSMQNLANGIYYIVPVFSNGDRAVIPVIKR